MTVRVAAPAAEQTLTTLLRRRALETPDQTAYRFAGADSEESLTFGQLDHRASSIARGLSKVAAPGERAVILASPGLDFLCAFFGCIYAGVIAVPVSPPRNGGQSVLRVVADSGASCVISARNSERFRKQLPDGVAWLDCSSIATSDDWAPAAVAPESIAFLQYTSGSTSAPRGVIVTHANLMANLSRIDTWTGPGKHGVFWLPPYHDMGLVGGILEHLYWGEPVTLMSPTSFLQKPLLWLETISKLGATHAGGPNFAFDLCVRSTTEEQRRGLDLSSWRVAYNGSEPVRRETIDRFCDAFEPYGFRREAMYPCYGLAEATLIVSGGPSGRTPRVLELDATALMNREIVAGGTNCRTLVSCGEISPDDTVLVVHETTGELCGPDALGEVWLAGPCVSAGYWNNETATARRFGAELASTNGHKFLRTGDLGFVRDGELFVAGRLDDVIIVRGQNHYPHDIEHDAESSHRSIRAAAAFEHVLAGQTGLVVVLEPDRHDRQPDMDAIASAVRQSVADGSGLEVQSVVLLKPLGIPRTTSGKIQRYLCSERYGRRELPIVAESRVDSEPRAVTGGLSSQQLEQWLIEEVARRVEVDPSQVQPNMPFAYYGLESAQAVAITLLLSDLLGRPIPATVFWDYPTVESLAGHLAA